MADNAALREPAVRFYARMHLTVHERNAVARQFYEKAGWIAMPGSELRVKHLRS